MVFVLSVLPLRAQPLTPLPNTAAILEDMYSGKRGQALSEIRQLQQKYPAHPLPFLLEAELEWWKI